MDKHRGCTKGHAHMNGDEGQWLGACDQHFHEMRQVFQSIANTIAYMEGGDVSKAHLGLKPWGFWSRQIAFGSVVKCGICTDFHTQKTTRQRHQETETKPEIVTIIVDCKLMPLLLEADVTNGIPPWS